MKAINKINSVASRAFLIIGIIGLVFLTSCEKKEDISSKKSDYTSTSDIRTESLAIHESDWCPMCTYSQVRLPVNGYHVGVNYEYIEVYILGTKNGSSEEEWILLPDGEVTYQIEDYNINVKKYDEISQEYYHFLVKIKVKS